jgi:hypothetical protein
MATWGKPQPTCTPPLAPFHAPPLGKAHAVLVGRPFLGMRRLCGAAHFHGDGAFRPRLAGLGVEMDIVLHQGRLLTMEVAVG